MSEIRVGATGTQEGSGGVSETVSEQATKARDKGRRELRSQLDERTTQIGRQARSLADVLRRSGRDLQSQGTDDAGIERVTSGVADRLEQAGGYLEEAKGEELLRDAEQFVRSRPWLVAGAAAAVGFVASRVFKASSERRYESSSARTSTRSDYSARAEGTPRRHDEPARVESGSLQTAGPAY